MSTNLDEDFIFQVYAIVEEIPKGKVATYGQIARLAGREKNSRLVGRALRYSNIYGNFPCHRVVNSSGRLSPGWDEQGGLLYEEGVILKENGYVDLKKYQWDV